ncbi:hypothetical protein FACS1894180_8450 [Bacteroidia bacterium]|nr:hypothetical protein FACS1894180_8450 [Bacteroidia bacterium]
MQRYEIIPLNDYDYCFFSKGVKTIIEKRVAFRPSDLPNYFRLSFGDFINGYIEEDITTNNNDTELVIATVAWCVICFTQKSKDIRVKFSGITKARTRLFSIWISKNSDELLKYLHIYGYINNKCEKFRSNIRYNSFLISAK